MYKFLVPLGATRETELWKYVYICLCIAQCAVCTVYFPRNRTSWDMTSHLTIVISFNIFFPQLVRLRGKHFYESFCELQTLNLWFSLNYTPVSTTEFWRFMPQFLSKYMGILLSPCIIYRAILNTGGSYCTNSTLCNACGAIWWPNLKLMQVAPSGGQICN